MELNATSARELKNSFRFRSQKMEGWISVVVNCLLFGLKYWAGIASGSIAIIADAWHTLSDSVSSVAVILSARMSSKPPDSDHPYGHGRFELITSLFISVLLFLISYGFIREAWDRFETRQAAVYGTLAIAITILSVVSKEILARYAFRLGKVTGSQVLKADGWHHRSDAVSSLVILIGIFAGRYIWWIDSALALIVALMIGYAAWKIVTKTVSSLLGEPMEPETVEEIRTIGNEVCGRATDFHHFHYHNYISHSELTFHLRLPGGMPITEGHEIADRIEKEIRERLGIETTIHIEPLKSTE